MSDRAPGEATTGFSGRRTAVLTGAVIFLLALGSLFFPSHQPLGSRAVLLVLDPGCLPDREVAVYAPLGRFVGNVGQETLDVHVVRDLGSFHAALEREPEFVLCPDGVGLGLPDADYLPLVIGRRAAPQNLRPRSVLVYRKSAGIPATPWVEYPHATIIGDSLSLAGSGAWRRHNPLDPPVRGEGGPSFGPDPYDHSPALHALRLGCFDFAVVRQWDADRFFKAGLLSHLDYGVEVLTPPAPDLTLFVSRNDSPQRRLVLGDRLSSLGRNPEGEDPRGRELVNGLARLHLVGFNLLVEPDLDLVRRNFPGHWPEMSP